MISSQYGKEFVHQEYETIKKVYSIWLCAEPPQYQQNTITRYAMKEENIIGNVTEKKKILSEEFDITMTEILEKEIEDMCNLSKGVAQRGFQRGMEQGIEQETLRAIQSLMETLHLTAEQAMDALKVEDSKRSEYAEQLKAN